MPSLDKKDLEQIKDVVITAVDPYFTAIQKDLNDINENFKNVEENFKHMDGRFDKIEKLILADHKRRIEKLEIEVKELKELLAIK